MILSTTKFFDQTFDINNNCQMLEIFMEMFTVYTLLQHVPRAAVVVLKPAPSDQLRMRESKQM